MLKKAIEDTAFRNAYKSCFSGLPGKEPRRRQELRQNGKTAGVKPRILILRPDHIGDLIYSLPSLVVLKEALGKTFDLSLLIDPCNEALATKIGLIDEIHIFPIFNQAGKRCLPSLVEYESLVDRLGDLDAVIDLRPDGDSFFLIPWLSANQTFRICNHWDTISRKVVHGQSDHLDRELDKCGQYWFYSRHFYQHRPRLIFDFATSVSKRLEGDKPLEFQDAVARSRELLKLRFPSKMPRQETIALCFEARARKKLWAPKETKALIGQLIAQQAAFRLIGETRSDLGIKTISSYDLRAQMSLMQVFDYLSQARLYVGFDSGLAHFCALRGTPVICIYTGSTTAQTWSPIASENNLCVLEPSLPKPRQWYRFKSRKTYFRHYVNAQDVYGLIGKVLTQTPIAQQPTKHVCQEMNSGYGFAPESDLMIDSSCGTTSPS